MKRIEIDWEALKAHAVDAINRGEAKPISAERASKLLTDRVRWVRPTPDGKHVMEQPDWEERLRDIGPQEAMSYIKDHAQGFAKLSQEQMLFLYGVMQNKR